MKKINLSLPILTCAMFTFTSVFAQHNLKKSIGLDSLPNQKDSICFIPNYLGSFENSGYKVNDTVANFSLYDLDNKAYHLANLLGQNKPVVLISSSYTCPVFRNKISDINALYNTYKDRVHFLIVYTVEAHPEKDISPYFGKVNTGAANTNEGILYRQPKTYGERIQIVRDMLNKLQIDVPVIIDGPCNGWWLTYGPAPNNMTLIQTNGIVFSKHDWLNRNTNDLDCDLKKLLDGVQDCQQTGNGLFTHEYVSDTVVRGIAGEVLYGRGILKNDSKYRVNIKAARLRKNLPADWETSMCLDVCYGPDVDTAYFYLNPGQKLEYYIDFFTSQKPGNASLRLGFQNTDNTTNRLAVNYEITTLVSSTSNTADTNQKPYILPNPFDNTFEVMNLQENMTYIIKDINGKEILSGQTKTIASTKDILPGMYFAIYLDQSGQHYSIQKILKK